MSLLRQSNMQICIYTKKHYFMNKTNIIKLIVLFAINNDGQTRYYSNHVGR